MPTNWKDTSYDSILVIVDQLLKMVHNEPVQIPNDAPGLAEVLIDLVIRHPGPPNSIVGQSTPPSSGSSGTTFELDCGYHLRVFYENI